MARDRSYKQSLGNLGALLPKAKILLVGAGGIGCELLKNLVLSGFGEIHVVDLDTIDVSNLNRQFLFRQEHVKKPKALVAKETASQFNPNVKIEAHHANIKDTQYGIELYRRFNLVFNALDNLDARRHVNRMCLLANIPLIESGTTGFNGQVQAIKKGITECYDCNEKETPKTYPVCTIRSTPSQPIHCIVWAKSYLFSEVFGLPEDAADDLDNTENADNAAEIQKLKDEAQELNHIRQSIDAEDFDRKIFEKIYSNDVKRLQSLEDMWKSRTPPQVLDFDTLRAEVDKLAGSVRNEDQRVWNLTESVQIFSESTRALGQRLRDARASSQEDSASQHLTFDKDDEEMLNFVTAAANLRSAVFHIDAKSKFDVKQMAGNIVPAIATTNAMTAGLCVLEAFSVLRNQWKKAKLIFLETGPLRAFTSESLRPPNDKCSVCNVTSTVASIDTSRATIRDLIEVVVKEKLGYQEGVTIRNESTVLYDPDFDDNLTKTFDDLALGKDKILTIVDEDQEKPRVDVSLVILQKTFEPEEPPISIPEIKDIPLKPAKSPALVENGNGEAPANITATENAADSADAANELKRKREADGDLGDEENPGKKGKLAIAASNGSTATVVEDSLDGPIVLDD